LVLRAAGTNCDAETARGFELAGAEARVLHLNRLLENPNLLENYQLLAIPGGFSYGDDISAGRVFASQVLHRLRDALRRFIEAGKPVIGICNGFQVMVKTDLLPGARFANGSVDQACTLTSNDCGRYVDRWVTLIGKSRKCVWTSGIDKIDLPVGHGEGKFVPASDSVRRLLWETDQVALVYSRPDGSAAEGRFPENPNGSVDDIAGICDDSGLVFGLMPHPDRYLHPLQHPAWTSRIATQDCQELTRPAPGVLVFSNAVRHVVNAVGSGV
jgi:phosphoribosylformylglycinamidine synthase